MKYPLNIFLFFIIFLSISDSKAQFRNNSWGDTKEQVITNEGVPDHSSKDGIFYSGFVGSRKAVIYFTFIDNTLQSGGYLFEDSYLDIEDYKEDFEFVGLNQVS